MSWLTTRELARSASKRQRAQVAAADRAPRPAAGRRSAAAGARSTTCRQPLGPTMPIRSPARPRRPGPRCAAWPSAGIGEGDMPSKAIVGARRAAIPCVPRSSTIGLGVEQLEDATGPPPAPACRVQQRAQVAQRPEHLDAHHQDDEQHLRLISPSATRQAPSASAAAAPIAMPVSVMPRRQRVGRQHPHGAAEQLVGLVGQLARRGAALAESIRSARASGEKRRPRGPPCTAEKLVASNC